MTYKPGPIMSWRGEWNGGTAIQLAGSAYAGTLDSSQNYFGPTDWSIAAWVKTSTTGVVQAVCGTTTGVDVPGIRIAANGSWGYRDVAGTYHQLSATNIQDGKWHLLVVTYNSTTHNVIGYLDGAVQSTASGVTNTINPDVFITFGGDNNGSFLTGYLSNWAFANSVLASTDVTFLWNARTQADVYDNFFLGNSAPSMETYFKFNEANQSQPITDYVGNYNGVYTLSPAPTFQQAPGGVSNQYNIDDVVYVVNPPYGNKLYVANSEVTGIPQGGTGWSRLFTDLPLYGLNATVGPITPSATLNVNGAGVTANPLSTSFVEILDNSTATSSSVSSETLTLSVVVTYRDATTATLTIGTFTTNTTSKLATLGLTASALIKQYSSISILEFFVKSSKNSSTASVSVNLLGQQI